MTHFDSTDGHASATIATATKQGPKARHISAWGEAPGNAQPRKQGLKARHIAFLFLAAAVFTFQGCKSSPSNEALATAKAVPVESAPPLDPATLGSISGSVHLTGKPPAPVKIDTSMDPACVMSGAPDFNAEQYVAKDGKLANVYIYIKESPPAAMSAPAPWSAPVVLDQKGCRYTPHVIAVYKGGSVSFQNSDVTMHNIHTMPTTVGNEAIDISQGPKGAPIVKRFDKPETMLPVRCNNHPWMNAFINVSATPFFAVTDASGHFDLKGLPAGDYVLGAVHEKLGEQTLKLTVPAKGTAKADLTFAIK